MLELQSPFPVTTPLGRGYAIIFESDGSDNWWTVILDNGALVTFPQKRIRAVRSYSHGRIPDNEMKKIIEPRNDVS